MSTPIQKVIASIKEQTKDIPNRNQVDVIEIQSIRFQQFSVELKNELEKYTNLQSLTINDCEINSLENFPRLPNLKRLDLVFNQIPGQDIPHLAAAVRNLWTLIMGSNNIQKLEELRPFSTFPNLVHLDVLNNPVEEETNFRDQVFALLPRVVFLDQYDKQNRDFQSFALSLSAAGVPSFIFQEPKQSSGPAAQQGKVLDRKKSQQNIQILNQFNLQKLLEETTQKDKQPSVSKTQVQQEEQKQDKQEVPQPQKQQTQAPAAAPPAAPIVAPPAIKPVVAVAPPTKRVPPVDRKLVSGKAKGSYSTIISQSTRAGLTYPVGRISRYLKERSNGLWVSQSAPVYMSAILEYITAEILEIAGNAAQADRQKRIVPSSISRSIRNDAELHKFFKSSVISEGGQL